MLRAQGAVHTGKMSILLQELTAPDFIKWLKIGSECSILSILKKKCVYGKDDPRMIKSSKTEKGMK